MARIEIKVVTSLTNEGAVTEKNLHLIRAYSASTKKTYHACRDKTGFIFRSEDGVCMNGYHDTLIDMVKDICLRGKEVFIELPDNLNY